MVLQTTPDSFDQTGDTLDNASEINWYDFLRNKVNSFIKWDLVRFFHDNPHTRDTVENLARYTLRDARVIHRELDDLVAVGVLKVTTVNSVRVYQLSDDPDLRQLISTFMEACQDREFRVKAIHHVIRGMQFTPRHER